MTTLPDVSSAAPVPAGEAEDLATSAWDLTLETLPDRDLDHDDGQQHGQRKQHKGIEAQLGDAFSY
jgi:hypothetical protein